MAAQCEQSTGASAERLGAIMESLGSWVEDLGPISELLDEKMQANGYSDALYTLIEDASLQTALKDFGGHLRDSDLGGDDVVQSDSDELLSLRSKLFNGVGEGLSSTLSGHGHFGAFAASLVYGDSAECCEDAEIGLEWFVAVCGALLHIQLVAKDLALVNEAVQRATMLLKIAAIRQEGSAKGPEAILTQWSAVWKLSQDLSPTSACDDDPLAVLHSFCKAAHVLDVEKPIFDFVVGLASSYKCASVTTAVTTTVDELRGILPQKVGDLVDSVRAFITLKQTADHIKEGQGVGILQCSAVLRKVTVLVDMVAAWVEYASDYKVVHEAFYSMLSEVLAKCDLPLLDQFKATYGRVSAAVASWEFVGDMAWLASPTPDLDMDADIKALAQFINAHPMTLRIVEELVTLGDKMTWATDTQKKSLADAKVAFNAADKLVREVGGILGTMVLANALLTNSAVEASKASVTSKLKI